MKEFKVMMKFKIKIFNQKSQVKDFDDDIGSDSNQRGQRGLGCAMPI